MGFFSKLFGGKKVNKQSSKIHFDNESIKNKKVNTLADNEEKPQKIFSNFVEMGLPEIETKLSGNAMMDIITFLADFGKKLKEEDVSYDNLSFLYNVLLEDGMLRVPLVLTAAGKKFSVFFIYTEDDAKRFNNAKKRVKQSDYPNALYLSTIDCDGINDELDALTPMHFEDLSYKEGETVKGDFGMWWGSAEDPLFYDSLTRQYLTEIYEVIYRFETIILGYILLALKMKGFETIRRVKLSDKGSEILITGPEYKKLILSVSQEKGIRFHFHKETCSQLYRERFLKSLVVELTEVVALFKSKNIEQDPLQDEDGKGWFYFMCRVLEKEEKKSDNPESLMIGIISVD